MPIIKRVLEWGIFAFLLVVLLLVISPLLPFKGVPKIYVITSGSMEPTILTGSIVFTKNIEPKEIKVKDVVAFQNPSDAKSVILHRVVEIKTTDLIKLITKGDNNKTADNWEISAAGVLGKEILSVPYIGYVAMFIRKPLGFGLIVALPALIFIVMQILQIKTAINEEVEKKISERLGDKNKRDTITKLMAIILGFGLTLYLGSIHTAKALFKSNVTVSNFRLEAVKGTLECEKDDDREDDDEENEEEDEHENEHEDRDDHENEDEDEEDRENKDKQNHNDKNNGHHKYVNENDNKCEEIDGHKKPEHREDKEEHKDKSYDAEDKKSGKNTYENEPRKENDSLDNDLRQELTNLTSSPESSESEKEIK